MKMKVTPCSDSFLATFIRAGGLSNRRAPVSGLSIKAVFFTLIALVVSSGLYAEGLRLAGIFRDNAVLQQGKVVPVWGWAAPEASVRVFFGDQEVATRSDSDGKWQVELAAMEASREGRRLRVESSDDFLEIENILVGEVWIAAGQSNMNYEGPDRPTGLYPHYQSTGTSQAEVRRMEGGFGASPEPVHDIESTLGGEVVWEILGSGDFAKADMARFFARIVRDRLDVPVGIVHVAVSGTNQAAWMPRETLEAFPGGKGHSNFYDEFRTQQAANLEKHGEPTLDALKALEKEWRESGKGQWPGSRHHWNYPSVLHNTRIYPLAPMAFRGMIWHQGEGGPGQGYGLRMVAKVRQWRELFGQDFAFIWGTLARDTSAVPPLTPWPQMFYRDRVNQSMYDAVEGFMADEQVAMVGLYDVGDHDTHFLQKAESGRRLAMAALDKVYGHEALFTGPRSARIEVLGDSAAVHFEYVGEGLVYEPSINGISGFYIEGSEGQPKWAEVSLTGPSTVRLSHPEVNDILSVGYALNPNPHETLFNSGGLPALPFRHGFGRIPWRGNDEPPQLLSIETEDGSKVDLNLSHVRRSGYIFYLNLPPRGRTGLSARISAFLPEEWDDFVITVGDQVIEPEIQNSAAGKIACFEAPVDGSRIVVAHPRRLKDLSIIDRY